MPRHRPVRNSRRKNTTGEGFVSYEVDELAEGKNAAACYLVERGFSGEMVLYFSFTGWYEPARVSGPPENCSPADGDMDGTFDRVEFDVTNADGEAPDAEDLTALFNSIDQGEALEKAQEGVEMSEDEPECEEPEPDDDRDDDWKEYKEKN